VIFVSHQMPDVLAVCDRVTVLRLGELAATLDQDQLTSENLVGYITGAKTGATGATGATGPGDPAANSSPASNSQGR
jgi:ABC-type sugar transport system ATPase subunit